MSTFDFTPRTRVIFGAGVLDTLGELARDLGFRRTLLVADPGLRASGHAAHAERLLEAEDIEVVAFHDFDHDPDSDMIERGAAALRPAHVSAIVALGGGSSLDCAKGLNFLLTNGGRMQDYRGYGKASRPMLPMIGVPTTAGTGSEAQTYALIADARSHEKMACGDPKAAFAVALLDPQLTASLPRGVTASAGYDAIAHAVESAATIKRNAFSSLYAREAFRLADGALPRVLDQPADLDGRGSMMLAAHLAGLAIEASMLGAAHACANPLSARYGTVHGVALALLLPHVVRWNAPAAAPLYAELLRAAGRDPGPDAAVTLAARLEEIAVKGGLPRRLAEVGVAEGDLPALAAQAAEQWTGRFNPRPFDARAALELYRAAL